MTGISPGIPQLKDVIPVLMDAPENPSLDLQFVADQWVQPFEVTPAR